MVELCDRRILIDDKPVLIFAGELHYFRLRKDEWEDRILKAKALGCTAIASYIPWVVHEEHEGDIDVAGRLRPENDVAGFIDLCHRHGLWFIARPGPFVMAEMKNEGIPYWVYERCPDARPVTWEGESGRSKTLDLLDPGYLAAARRWYEAIMPVLADRLQPKAGPVIGVQLDNEIGMLSWVNNQPDLGENMLCDFAAFVGRRYPREELRSRYPFDMEDPAPRMKALRNPEPRWAAAFLRDLGDFERNQIRRYVAELRSYAEDAGVRGVPFIVNIHGSGGGRGQSFPIGIQQLAESYNKEDGFLPGSDHYLGELTRQNAPDLHLINAFMTAVNRPGQPISSLEFEVGTGDYGETGAMRVSGASADFKVRLSAVQGNRLINYYLLAGGRNPHLLHPVGDGNDRVAFTGERHGFAAPISPEGALDAIYNELRSTTLGLSSVGVKLADMDEEHDPVALGFLPDYYKTAYHRPGPMEEIVGHLEWVRGPLEVLGRAMLWQGFRFPAIDLQNRPLDAEAIRVLALASSRHMDPAVQAKLASFVLAGGSLFLFGEFPTMTMEHTTCRVLADALGMQPKDFLQASGDYHLSLRGDGWAAQEPEVRVWRAQTFEAARAEVFLRAVGSDLPCGLTVSHGRGRATVLAANYPLHMGVFSEVFRRLGVAPGIQTGVDGGLLLNTVANRAGGRFVSLINLDAEPKVVRLVEAGSPMFGGPVELAPRTAKLLPLGAKIGAIQVAYSTAEVVEVDSDSVRFRGTGAVERIVVAATSKPVATAAEVTAEGSGRWKVRSIPHAGDVIVRIPR